MPIDSYSLCPGGTGKKVKFCCPDAVSELNDLDRMIHGEQHLAALRQIESLEKKGPPRACLLAWKIQLLRTLKRDDEADATIALFLEHYSDNPIALAESAIQSALTGDGRAAVEKLQQALAVSQQQVSQQFYAALGIVAEALLASGDIPAARSLLQLQLAAYSEDKSAMEALTELARSPMIPLQLKVDPPWKECPADASWKARFEEAMAPLGRALWSQAADRLTALTNEVPDSPAIWHNLAVLRGWMADRAGAVEAWRKLASLDIPLEEAVEAQATAMLLSDDPLGDRVDATQTTFTIQDADHLAGLLSTWQHAVQIPSEMTALGEDDVPPKAHFQLTDKPLPASAEGMTLDDIPRLLGHVFLYGRQTDRDARLVLFTSSPGERDRAIGLLREIAGEQLAAEPEVEVIGDDSATATLFRRPWRLPDDTSRTQLVSLFKADLRRSLMERWPALPLGCLDGQTPTQAAEEPESHIKILAAILVLRGMILARGRQFDLNELRAKLGLPILEPIDPEQISPDTVPLLRLHRLIVEKLSDEALREAFHRAAVFSETEATQKLGRAMVNRPSIENNERRAALEMLVRTEDDLDQALEDINQGRRLAEEAGQSCAAWDLMELEFRIARGDGEDVVRLIEHLHGDHAQEPGVAQALTRLLIETGILRPDGTPAAVPSMSEAPTAEPASSGLWTPDGDSGSSERPKLWTPDMDG
ncbi:MAG: hypothetical protein JW818_14775 [Pirellulales bacterium]|nr:hypothetical protein [Pirellulales bacterium]